MHANAHHLGRVVAIGVAFSVQRVKGVLHVLKERVGVRIALGQRKAHVVAVQRVGHDQLGCIGAVAFAHLHPKRQVVAVVVAVVFKAAKVSHQAARVGAVAPGVPAQGAFACEFLNDLHRLGHVGALGGFVDILVMDPLEAVAGDVVAQFLEGGSQLGVLLQRGGHAKHSERQAALFKLAQDAPHARTRAVFVNAFHADVPLGEGRGVEHFRQELFGTCIAVQHRVFAAFFVVQDKLHRHAGTAGPLGVWYLAAVTFEVAGVGEGGVVSAHESQ